MSIDLFVAVPPPPPPFFCCEVYDLSIVKVSASAESKLDEKRRRVKKRREEKSVCNTVFVYVQCIVGCVVTARYQYCRAVAV